MHTYTASPKVDYSGQFEMKIEGETEDDPDIIPMRYDKKPSDDFCRQKMECNTIKMYSEVTLNSPNRENSAFVNKGVTARSNDIAASRPLDIITAARHVRESCI